MSITLERYSSIPKSKFRFKGSQSATMNVQNLPEHKLHRDSVQTNVEKQNKSVFKKATAGQNPSGRLSFKGGVPSVALNAGKDISKTLSYKIAKNPLTVKFVQLAADNMLLFDAAFALLITCGMRPAAIMAISGKDKASQEKSKKAASHSISSGLIGLGFALAIAKPLNASFAKLAKQRTKYMSEQTQEFVKKLSKEISTPGKAKDSMDAVKTIYTKGSDIVFAPVRAMVTIGLIPVIDKLVLNKVFKTPKDSKKAENKEIQSFAPYTNIYFKRSSDVQSTTFKKLRGDIA